MPADCWMSIAWIDPLSAPVPESSFVRAAIRSIVSSTALSQHHRGYRLLNVALVRGTDPAGSSGSGAWSASGVRGDAEWLQSSRLDCRSSTGRDISRRRSISILSQSFSDLELIISDNASTDDTEAIGRSIAARDPRVTYQRNGANVGIAANFNLLVPLARGRLFKWATADDLLRPGYLERCVSLLESEPSRGARVHQDRISWTRMALHWTSRIRDGTWYRMTRP